jgi:hypothetical protein
MLYVPFFPMQVKLQLMRFATRLFTKPHIQSQRQTKPKKKGGKPQQHHVALMPLGIRNAYSLEDTFMRIFPRKFWPAFIASGLTKPTWGRKKMNNVIIQSSKKFKGFWEGERRSQFHPFHNDDRKELASLEKELADSLLSPEMRAAKQTLKAAAAAVSVAAESEAVMALDILQSNSQHAVLPSPAVDSEAVVEDGETHHSAAPVPPPPPPGTSDAEDKNGEADLPDTPAASPIPSAPAPLPASTAVETEAEDGSHADKGTPVVKGVSTADRKKYRPITNMKNKIKLLKSLEKFNVTPSCFDDIYSDVWPWRGQDNHWTGLAWRTLTIREATDKLNLIKFFFRGVSLDVTDQHIHDVVNSAAAFLGSTTRLVSQSDLAALKYPRIEFALERDAGWFAMPEYCVSGIAVDRKKRPTTTDSRRRRERRPGAVVAVAEADEH